MRHSSHLVIFALDEQRFGLPLDSIDRIVRVVEVTPLHDAPGSVIGVINVKGQIVPVINLRKRCGLPMREIALTDQLIIAHTPRRTVALLVDAADVCECGPGAVVPTEKILPGWHDAQDVLKREDGLVLIYELERLLSTEDHDLLDGAIGGTVSDAGARGGAIRPQGGVK